MSTLSQARAPYLHPAPDRMWWGQCPRGHTLYLTDDERARMDEATKQRDATPPLENYRGLRVALMLPCGDIYYFDMRLYRRDDGSFFYK